jgi:hypothetical protein
MGLGIRSVLAGLVMVLAQGAAAQLYWPDAARPPATDTFGDWIVACRPDRYCQAGSLPVAPEGQGAFAVVYRNADDPQAWTSIYIPHGAEDPSSLGGISVEVRVSGPGGEIYRATWTADAPPAEAEYGPLDPTSHYRARPAFDGHMPFIEAVRGGDVVAIRAEGFADRISLSGSAAALRRMDARQGLAGTTAALVERGDAALPVPAEMGPAIGLRALTLVAVDPPPPLSADLPLPPQDGDCDGVEPHAWKLADGRMLWGVCELWGNTNMLYRFWLAVPGSPIDVAFVRRGAAGEDPQVLANPVLEHDGLVIRSMELGRGVGDCGEIARWLWDAVRGPMLVHFAEMPDCRGIPPEAWPVLLDVNYLPDHHEGGDQ